MTKEQILAWAHATVLDAIEDEMQDWMGIHEQLDEDTPPEEADALAAALCDELAVIRDTLAAKWRGK